MFDVGAETSNRDSYVRVLELTERAGELEELQRLIERNVKNRLVFLERCKLRFLVGAAVAYLNDRTESSDLDRDRFPGCGVGAEYPFPDFMLEAHVVGFLDFRMENVIEISDLLLPFGFAFGNEVEALLEIRRKIEI